MRAKVVEFFKKEAVLCIALVLAVISSCVILPDKEYLGYIDFHTLAILFCLMSVMAGLQKLGLFLFQFRICRKYGNIRSNRNNRNTRNNVKYNQV